MTDEVNERASVSSNGSHLLFSCFPGKKELGILMDVFPAGGTDRIQGEAIQYVGTFYPVTVRLDDRPAMTALWQKSGSTIRPNKTYTGQAAPAPSQLDADAFQREVYAVRRFRIRLTNRYDRSNIDIDFSTAGAAAAVEKLRAACALP